MFQITANRQDSIDIRLDIVSFFHKQRGRGVWEDIFVCVHVFGAALSRRIFEVVFQKQMRKKNFDHSAREKSTRTPVPPGPKVQASPINRHQLVPVGVVWVGRVFALACEPETVELGGVTRDHVRIMLDRVCREADLGPCW